MATRSTLKSVFKAVVLSTVMLCLCIEPALSAPASAKKRKTSAKGKNLYGMVWNRTRPKSRTVRRSSRISAVAGVRGAKKEQRLEPYWKGGKKITPDMREFTRVSELVNDRKYDQAATAFKEWLDKYPDSKLAPKVELGMAVCYAYLDRKVEAKRILEKWLKKNKGHELESSAKQLLEDISAPGG